MGNYLEVRGEEGEDSFVVRFNDDYLLAALTDNARSGDRETDDDVIERAIDDAEGEINTRLAARYDGLVPFSSPPDLVVQLTYDLAYCYLYEWAHEDEKVEGKRERAEAILTNLATGRERLKIPADEPGGDAPVTTPTIDFEEPETPLTDALGRMKP